MSPTRPLVANGHFVLATRDSGYRGIASAVAELVDNAIQGGATVVQIVVREERTQVARPTGMHRELTIGVLDNGRGMDHEGLWTAVQFGGTERFNDRGGLGRFGMGLPNSSVSVTRRLDVYSWRSHGEILYTYLDIDEVFCGGSNGIPEPRPQPLPFWAAEAASPTGTLIVWPRCDRLNYKKASTVAEKLLTSLGRIYRRPIWGGLNILVNGEVLRAVDPLFCHPDTGTGGGVAYGSPLRYEISVPGERRASTVIVRFTELPVAEWQVRTPLEKRSAGIVGKAGASFVRAGREIDYSWELFGGKRRENYDDWWRCEVSFEPDLDELFGVTHSKQGVCPTPYLRSIVEPEMEAVARLLNARVRTAFEAVKRVAPSDAAAHASRQDDLLPPSPARARHARPSAGLSYTIALAAIPGPEFFEVIEDRGKVRVTINTDHPFYERIYAPTAAESPRGQRYAIECLLLAAARAHLAVSTRSQVSWTAYRRAWSDALAAFLETKGARR